MPTRPRTKGHDPLLAPLLAIAFGILISRWIVFQRQELLIALPALLVLTLAAWKRNPRLGFGACLVTLCFAGIFADVLHRPRGTPTIDATSQETVILDGCVVDPPIFYEGRDQFTVQLAHKASARVTMNLKDDESPPDLHYGQNVEFEAKVRPIRNFHNPGSFDFEAFSARREIYWNASVRGDDAIKVLPGRCGSRFFAAIFALRTAALQRIESLYPGDSYAVGMMQAILLGETAKLEKIWTEHFRRTGTFHTLVISGMHISVLAGSFLLLLRVCFVPQMPALALTALATWIYALVTGCNAPAVRAAGALTLYLAGRYFYRRGRLINLLAAVGIVYLLYDPGQMFESSFQLSFLSVLVLAVLAVPFLDATTAPFSRGLEGIDETSRDLHLEPKVAQFRVELRLLAETLSLWLRFAAKPAARILSWTARLGFYVFDMVIISTVIQVGLALPMAIYFHRISLSGLSANVIIVPLLCAAVPIGFAAVFTGWHWIAALARLLLIAGEKVANWHIRFEPDRRVPDPPLWLCFAFIGSLLLLAFVIRRSWRWQVPVLATLAVLFGFVLAHPFPPLAAHGVLEMTAIDVGQGDGLLVAFPDGRLMMVDSGGFPNFGKRKIKTKLDIGEDVVSPYLWRRSINQLDVIVCTHAHEDHVGGMAALIDNFHPAELWTGANGNSPVWHAVRDKAVARGVRIRPMHCCESFDFGGARLDVLSPPPDYQPEDDPKNDDSLVFRIRFGKHTFLLTGDMEKPMEAELLETGKLGHIDVLKVPHHGSKTSSTEPFLDAVQPSFALISDGFENMFHHPHPSVLARLAEHHAAVLRTDQQGLISIRSDGRHLSLETNVALPKGPNLTY